MSLERIVSKYRGLILPVGILACIGVLLVPLPAAMMDLLLAANIAISLIVLLTTISIKTPLEFSVFPSLLVATTLGRLVLNVGTTRLILTNGGTDRELAAGGMIRAFGDFVAGDVLVVGIVIFAIIVLIQFLVITKGATRISEVAARFALDGMPGRQMAIDADLNAGTITDSEAQRMRQELTEHADFYGAMDGASKFVRGDALAGVLITAINIVGGLCVGVFYAGMSASESVEVFTRLTIGDGLASQIPAFLISIAAAMLVTRSTKSTSLPDQFLSQLFASAQSLMVAGVFLGLLVFTNLPTIPLLVLGGACIALSWLISRQSSLAEQAAQAAEASQRQARNLQEQTAPERLLSIDPLRVELGLDLLPLADPRSGGDLMERISVTRTRLAQEMGFLLPKVRLKDNLKLKNSEYTIYLADNVLARGRIDPDAILAVDQGQCRGELPGETTRDPITGAPALWIPAVLESQARAYGYHVVQSRQLIADHLDQLGRRHAPELLTREQTRLLVDELRKSNPSVVEEVIPSALKLAQVQAVLQILLREQIPIRQLSLILETLGEKSEQTKDPERLAQYVRERLSRTISHRFSDGRGHLQAILLDPQFEDYLANNATLNGESDAWPVSPRDVQDLCQRIMEYGQEFSARQPVLIVRPAVRALLRRLTYARLPDLVVLSHSEITPETVVQSVGLVKPNIAAA